MGIGRSQPAAASLVTGHKLWVVWVLWVLCCTWKHCFLYVVVIVCACVCLSCIFHERKSCHCAMKVINSCFKRFFESQLTFVVPYISPASQHPSEVTSQHSYHSKLVLLQNMLLGRSCTHTGGKCKGAHGRDIIDWSTQLWHNMDV